MAGLALLNDPAFQAAVELHKSGRFEDAGRAYQALIEQAPNDSDLWHFKGLLAAHQGRFDEAVRLISLAIVLKPGDPEYFQNLGLAYAASGNVDKAAESFNKQGNALQEQCRFAEALPAYERALGAKPGFAPALMNQGAALDRLGRYAEAHCSFQAVLANVDNASGNAFDLMNRANALSGLGRAAEAMAVYDRVLAAEPDNATAHCSKALLSLRLGDFEAGWREYEWRWARQGGFKEPRGQFRQPVWNGEPPEDLHGPLLVIAEQGFGDVIQFARYVPLLADRGYEVIFETLPELAALFAEGFDHSGIRVVPRVETPLALQDNLPFAAWTGVMGLPHRFGTRLQTIPAHGPYLRVASVKAEQWQEIFLTLPRKRESRLTNLDSRLLRNDGVLKVGIVWAGNPKNLNDFARSIPFELLSPLWNAPVEFFSLQKGPASADVMNHPALNDLNSRLSDFTETAAAILALDLVIAVDTSVAHLAGALGKPVWLMIPVQPYWRWLDQSETTRWYPTMRIFRQSVRGQWQDVIASVATALSAWAGFPG